MHDREYLWLARMSPCDPPRVQGARASRPYTARTGDFTTNALAVRVHSVRARTRRADMSKCDCELTQSRSPTIIHRFQRGESVLDMAFVLVLAILLHVEETN